MIPEGNTLEDIKAREQIIRVSIEIGKKRTPLKEGSIFI